MKQSRYISAIGLIITCLLLSACHKIAQDVAISQHGNFNEAIAEASSKEILLNTIRAYKHQAPSFLTISSITTSNSYNSPSISISQNGFKGANFFANTEGSISSYGVKYQPNITLIPNSGEEYANRLLTPLTLRNIGTIAYAENNIGLLLRLTASKIGPWVNYPPLPNEHHIAQVIADEKNFQAFCELLQAVYAENGHRLFFRSRVTDPNKTDTRQSEVNKFYTMIIPIKQPAHFTQQELKLLQPLHIDNTSKAIQFSQNTHPQNDMIDIKSRTLVSTLKYLSSLIKDVPQSASISQIQPLLSRNFFSIYSSKQRPENSYLSIKNDDLWFYIKNDDTASKETFEALELLFNITRIVPQSNSTVLVSG